MEIILVNSKRFGTTSNSLISLLKKAQGNKLQVYVNNRLNETRSHLEAIRKINPSVIIAGTEKYNRRALEYAPNLKLIARVGSGFDNIDLEACSDNGISVSNTPREPARSVAELVIGQILNMTRNLRAADMAMRNRIWERMPTKALEEHRVGIVGVGNIGSEVARLALALNFQEVFVNDIVPAKANSIESCIPLSIEELISNSDIITLHIPLNRDNYNFFNQEKFNILRKNACFINCSRGAVVNEAALLNWLKENPSAKAAIDTYSTEPYTGKLCDLPNTYLTPHIASMTYDARHKMESCAVQEVHRFLSGKPLRFPVN